jgi:hypothetical protein
MKQHKTNNLDGVTVYCGHKSQPPTCKKRLNKCMSLTPTKSTIEIMTNSYVKIIDMILTKQTDKLLPKEVVPIPIQKNQTLKTNQKNQTLKTNQKNQTLKTNQHPNKKQNITRKSSHKHINKTNTSTGKTETFREQMKRLITMQNNYPNLFPEINGQPVSMLTLTKMDKYLPNGKLRQGFLTANMIKNAINKERNPPVKYTQTLKTKNNNPNIKKTKNNNPNIKKTKNNNNKRNKRNIISSSPPTPPPPPPTPPPPPPTPPPPPPTKQIGWFGGL